MAAGSLALLAGALLASSGPITDVAWTRLPTAEEMVRHTPRRPLPAPPGHATIECVVSPNGLLTDCVIVKEGPDGWGYGDIAIKVSRYFRAAAVTKSGEPAAGRRVRVPMVFKAPQ